MKKLIFLIVSFFATALCYADEVQFVASAPSAVPNGETFQLVYTINSKAKDLRIPEISDFDIVAGPFQSTSSSTQIINGSISSSTTLRYTYTLLPKKEGTFVISPATIVADKKKYSSNALTIKVLPADESAKTSASGTQQGRGASASQGAPLSQSVTNDNLFIRTIVSKHNVYEQEAILVTYKIYTRVDLINIDNVKFPDFKGFLMQEIDLPKDKQFSLENYNNKNYNTIVIRQVLLYPQHSGTLDIDKMSCDAVVRVRNNNRPRSFFDDFFDTYQEVSKSLSTNAEKIEVKPFPAGKPANFSGIVGDFKLVSSINKTNLKVNEPVTLKIKISGNGNLKLVATPEVKFPTDFEIYDPKVENNFSNTVSGVSGTKTIEYLAIPRHNGEYTIPPIQFAFFDINTKTYKTLETESYTLSVEKGDNTTEGTQAVVSNYSNKESIQLLGSDIHHISMNDFVVSQPRAILFGTWVFWLFYVVPILLVAFVFWLFRKQAKMNADISAVRNRKANKIARKRLKFAEKYLKEGRKEDFYAELLKALWGYLGDKLGIPQSELNKNNIEIELRHHEVEDGIIADFMSVLNDCEFGQYAPGEDLKNRNNLYEEAKKIILKLEQYIKK